MSFFLLLKSFCLSYRKPVAALVFRVPGVTLYPDYLHLMYLAQIEQLFPQIGIESGLFFCAHPALSLPLFCPALCKSVADILRVAVQGDLARFFKGGKGIDDRGKLHTVVCGLAFSARELLFDAVVAQNSSPAAGTGIAAAGSVSEYINVFHSFSFLWTCISRTVILFCHKPAIITRGKRQVF